MNTFLPIPLILKNSLIHIKEHFLASVLFFALSFLGLYASIKYDINDNLELVPVYLIYIYLFFYGFICIFFGIKKITWLRFKNAFIRMCAILLLAFAAIAAFHLGIRFLKFMTYPLQSYPEIYLNLKAVYNFMKESIIVQRIIIFSISTFIFFIPAFAWVSAIIGRDASITATFFRTRKFYVGLFILFLTVFGILPLLNILLLEYISLYVSMAISAVISLFQITVYLKTYETFYRY